MTIIGEATTHLRKTAPEVALRITDARKIIAFCNILVHGYDMLDDAVVWGVLENGLPRLISEVAASLAEAQGPES